MSILLVTYKLKNLKTQMVSILVSCILFTCQLVNYPVTNIQNSEAFVKCFGAFSWVVKEEKLPLLKEKKLPG